MYAIRWLLSLILLTGCVNSQHKQLVGTWIGGPQSAEQRNMRLIRDAAGGAVSAASVQGEGSPADPTSGSQDEPSDSRVLIWEQFEFGIRLTLAADGTAAMSLADGSQPKRGTWRIVESLGRRILIQISASESDVDAEPAARRFRLVLHRQDGEVVGFSLDHDGADPHLGSLFFERAEQP